jgi:hypothetical protein
MMNSGVPGRTSVIPFWAHVRAGDGRACQRMRNGPDQALLLVSEAKSIFGASVYCPRETSGHRQGKR